MQRSYLDYAMSVIVAARAAGRARRAQAGAPPRALRDVRRRLPPRPRLLQVRARRRRRHGQLPPARRHRDLRHLGAPRPAVVAALPAGRRPRQLRLARATTGSRDALLRDCGDTRIRHGRRYDVPHRRRRSRQRSRTATTTSDVKVLGPQRRPGRASKLFHSGEHPTLRITHERGLSPHRHAQPPGALPGRRRSASRCCCGSCSRRSQPGDRVAMLPQRSPGVGRAADGS